MSPRLFTPIAVGPLTLPNRIVVAPMCQYSAVDGAMTDWHLQHLMNLAMSGAGMVTVEATAVERHGRITHGCTGLYSDACEYAMARVLAAARSVAAPGTTFSVQLAHAGRKASQQRPWEGGLALTPDADPWPTRSASALPVGEGWPVPRAMDEAEIEAMPGLWADAARRSARLGFEAIELHMTHGYLLHQFLSPISNARNDRWGGSYENRMRLPLAVFEAVKAAVPATMAVGARITGTDWSEAGVNEQDAVTLANALKALGVDFLCVSSGGIAPGIRIPSGAGYQVHLARLVKEGSGVQTRAVGLISTPAHAEAVIAEGHADMVALGRPMLDDPRWPWHAAQELGAVIARPPQYARAAPKLWSGAAELRPATRQADAA